MVRRALLVFNNKEISKTHDIAFLIKECAKLDKEFENLFDINADILSSYAIKVRYPDDFYFPSLKETKNIIEIARKTKSFILKKLLSLGIQV
ncbi:MAG: HEPN domain-containing protein [Candidatus Hydrogenedens sp.]|nr:HEPN domain-containing protein [Candidatus Hydrogenedens sp.]